MTNAYKGMRVAKSLSAQPISEARFGRRFSFYHLTLSVFLILLLQTNPVQSATVTDQDFLFGFNHSNQFNERSFAQTFTVGVSGQLQQIDLILSQLNPVGNLIIEIQSTINGMPAADAPITLATTLIPLSTLPSSSAGGSGPGVVGIDWSFANLLVEAGDELAIVLRKDSGGDSPIFGASWFGNRSTEDLYTDGAGWQLRKTGTECEGLVTPASGPIPEGTDCQFVWDSASTHDYAFRTYVSAVPLPATVWLLASALAALGWIRRK
jgi:hypothetical protein